MDWRLRLALSATVTTVFSRTLQTNSARSRYRRFQLGRVKVLSNGLSAVLLHAGESFVIATVSVGDVAMDRSDRFDAWAHHIRMV